MTVSAASGCSINGIVLLFALFGYSVRADSWLPPRAFDTLSENGRFIAHVIPGGEKSKPRVVVSSIQSHRTNELWRATLSNDACPTQICVWDEGTGVVTLDNWGGSGLRRRCSSRLRLRGSKG